MFSSYWWDDNWPLLLVIGAIVLMIGLCILAVKYDHDYPCLEYGPEHFQYFQKVGDVMIPVYGKDCLKRAGRRSDIDSHK